MKMLKKWFGAAGHSADGASEPEYRTGHPPDFVNPEKSNDADEDTSFDSRALDSSSSEIFDSPDTHRVRVLKTHRVRPANDDDNPGYDPYDTGSFDAGNKG